MGYIDEHGEARPDRRSVERARAVHNADAWMDTEVRSVAATLINTSFHGAMLEVTAGTPVPQRFTLRFATTQVAVRVVWQSATRIGVVFTHAITQPNAA